MKQAVAYVRVSSQEQHLEGYSIPAQRKLLEGYAQEHGFQIVQVFEEVETAKKAGRQAFGAMLTFLKKSSACKTILVEKTDRLYRNFRDAVTVEDAGHDVHFVKENVILNDGTKSSEKFVHGIKVLVAKNYVDNLSEETSKGMLEKARQGLYPSNAPLGYLNDKETASIIPDPERAPLIRNLFEAYATGRESYKSITKLALQMGLRSKKGNKVSRANIGKLLSKLTYTGSFVWNGVTYQGTYEPIVSQALFAEVQNRINGVTFSNPKKHDHAFRGLVRCGECDCMVTGETKKKIYTYYRCTHNRANCDEKAVREEQLAEMLGAPLKSLRLTQGRIDWLVKSIQANEANSNKERSGIIKGLKNDQRDLETKQSLIYDDKLEGTITKEFWKRKNEEYSVRLNWIKGEIEKFSQEKGSGLANVQRLLELTQNAYSLYLKQKPHEQRKLLDLLQSNFKLKGQKVHAELRHPYDLIVDGALEDREKIKRGESIFAENENWVPE